VDKNKVLAGEIAKEVAKMVPRQHDYQIFPQEQLHTSDSLETLRKSPLPKPRGVESADHSVIQQGNSGGINVQQATVGNNSPIIGSPITITDRPPLPIVTWKTETLAASKDKKPGVMVHIAIDRSFPDAAFAALCDRPCNSVVAVIPTAGFTDSSGGSGKSNPSLIVIKLDLPRVVSSTDTVNWEVRSNDEGEIAVTKVQAVPQW